MEGKKISFGFSKSKPKPNPLIQRQEIKPKENVEYITSFDKNEKKTEGENPPELVIPVKTNYTVAERILAKKRNQDESTLEDGENSVSKASGVDENAEKPSTIVDEAVSIESLAIQELLDDSKKLSQKSNPTLAIPMNETEQQDAAPNNVDYDSVPVSQFGYAMLRGMGWAPGKGIGKKQKVVEVVDLTLRPRSLGLGADYIPDRKNNKKPEG
jgi:G patch domain/KOW motif-containing protein